MNELNPLFEAMSEIDDNIISKAVGISKRPFILKTGMIAAAAAIMATLVGFTVFQNNTPGVEIDGRLAFPYNAYVQEGLLFPSRDEMLEWGADEFGDYDDYMYVFKKDTMPSDLFDKFNFRPLLNDNFIEEKTEVYVNACLEWKDYTSVIFFKYNLTDKQIGVPVEFHVNCYYEMNENNLRRIFTCYGDMSGKHYEILDLNDGSKVLIYDYEWGDGMQSCVEFSYGGMVYTLYANVDMEDMEVILSDLGVL